MGYGVEGDAETAIYAQPVYSPSYNRTGVGILLSDRLDHLTSAEENILVDIYLDKLETLETDVLLAGDNIDTAEAGPWKANPREQADREKLFNSWRRKMCAFLNFEPGPGLEGGGLSIVRC